MKHLKSSQEEIEIVFLDLNMPVKSGFDCLKEIKQNEKFKDIQIIIYASHINEEYVDTTFDSGANLYVRKPSSFNEIKEILSDVLQRNWDDHNSNLNRDNFVYELSTY